MLKEDFLLRWNLVEADFMIIKENGMFIADVCPVCNEIIYRDTMSAYGENQPEYCECRQRQ